MSPKKLLNEVYDIDKLLNVPLDVNDDILTISDSKYSLRMSRKRQNSNSNDSDFDPQNHEITASSKDRPWDEQEIKELLLVFENCDLSLITQQVIRDRIYLNTAVKFRSAKQIYNKLHHMARKQILNSLESVDSVKQKVCFSKDQTRLIKMLFDCEISGKSAISEEKVIRTLANNGQTQSILDSFTSSQLVAKVKYERSRVTSKQKK